MSALIRGIGWVTALGMGHGRNRDRFEIGGGSLPKLTGKMIFEKPSRHFGRMDDYSRLGLAAAAFAMKDAGLDQWSENRNIGVIAATVFGCLQTDIDYYETVLPQDGILASPNLFAYTLPSTFLGEVSVSFGLVGTGFTVNERTTTGLSGVRMAVESIACNESEIMLAGVCDLGRPTLFNREVDMSPGAVFLVLEKPGPDPFSEYGRVTLDGRDRIRLNHESIGNMVQLVQASLTNLNSATE